MSVGTAVLAALVGAAAAVPLERDAEAPAMLRLSPTDIYGAVIGTLSPDGDRFAFERWEGGANRLHVFVRSQGRAHAVAIGADSAGDPAFSASGRLAFAGRFDGVAGLYAQDVAGRPRLVYAPASGQVREPAWLGEDTLLFALWTEAGPRLWRVERSGSSARALNVADFARAPAASPDGRRIVWVSRDGDGAGTLRVADAEGRGARTLVRDFDFGDGRVRRYGKPAWALDGSALFFTGRRGSDRLDAFRVALDAPTGPPEAQRLSATDGDALRVSVLRDGSVAVACYEPRLRLATLPVTGGEPQRVLPEPTSDAFLPMWSPDGRTLTLVAGRWRRLTMPDFMDVAAVDVDAEGRAKGEPRLIVAEEGEDYGGAYSPDGRWLAFHSHRQTTDDIYLRPARAPDGPIRSVSRFGPGRETGAPTWSPDGRRLLFSLHEAISGRGRLFVAEIEPATGEPIGEPRPLPIEGLEGTVLGGRFSWDGRQIAFQERRENGRLATGVVPAEGGPARTLADVDSAESYGSPDWSHDGRWVYFAAGGLDAPFRIFRVRASGGLPEPITPAEVSAIQPAISPDGRWLAVTLFEAPTVVRRTSNPGCRPYSGGIHP